LLIRTQNTVPYCQKYTPTDCIFGDFAHWEGTYKVTLCCVVLWTYYVNLLSAADSLYRSGETVFNCSGFSASYRQKSSKTASMFLKEKRSNSKVRIYYANEKPTFLKSSPYWKV